jgi:hypothetical protein
VVLSIRLRISWAVAIANVLLQLMDARTFVRNHDGIKAGYTEDVLPIALQPAKHAGNHDPYIPGLHHVAFRAASRADVDGPYQLLCDIDAKVLDPPRLSIRATLLNTRPSFSQIRTDSRSGWFTCRHLRGSPPNKARHLARHSAFKSIRDTLWQRSGCSAAFGGAVPRS